MNGSSYQTLTRQFVESVQKLYNVTVRIVHYDLRSNSLFLTTDSKYKGLDKLRFDFTEKDEKTLMQNYIERINSNPNEFTMGVKASMLNYWFTSHPKGKKRFFERKYQTQLNYLSNLLTDENVSVQDFGKALEGKFLSRIPLITRIKRAVIEPFYIKTGMTKKGDRPKIRKGGLMVRPDRIIRVEIKPVDSGFIEKIRSTNPVDIGKELLSRQDNILEQQRLEEEEKRLAKDLYRREEEEKVNRYIH